ncbi:MAG: PilZ domain-containing protein [Alphaproteobacteria bacterium]
MINRVLELIGLRTGNDDIGTRRKHIRHDGVKAEVEVGSKAYGVKDWSLGGVSFETSPYAGMSVGDKIQLTLKFKLAHEIVSIRQVGRVVRAAQRGMAAEFLPLSPEARRKFERVLDGLHAQRFLESQVVA